MGSHYIYPVIPLPHPANLPDAGTGRCYSMRRFAVDGRCMAFGRRGFGFLTPTYPLPVLKFTVGAHYPPHAAPSPPAFTPPQFLPACLTTVWRHTCVFVAYLGSRLPSLRFVPFLLPLCQLHPFTTLRTLPYCLRLLVYHCSRCLVCCS